MRLFMRLDSSSPEVSPTAVRPIEVLFVTDTSVITSKAANGYQFKTGQRK
jgi:hypothetical protein